MNGDISLPKVACLIVPPSVFLLDERVFVSLGILKVAAVLERAGVRVEFLDLSGVENYEEVVASHAKTSCASWFGITATTPQMPAATKVLEVLRKERKDASVILGGPHVTLVHAAYRFERKNSRIGRGTKAVEQLCSQFDSLVLGDGEFAVFETFRRPIPKLVDADDPKSSLFLKDEQLQELPFPARHLVDMSSYHYAIDGVSAVSLIAQLGCPFSCGFCGGRFSPFLRRIRMRSLENIVKEIESLYLSYGIKGFMLYDDELNVNPQVIGLMEKIRNLQEKLKVEFRLRGFVKAELFTKEQARSMYEAGFRWILVGFESGHERILTNINKKANRADNTRCVEIAHQHGLKVKALMSIGHPGESRETIEETCKWLIDTRPDDFDATVITTYPGTPYFDEAEETSPGVWTYTYGKTGDRLHSLEVDYSRVAEYYKGVPGEYTAYVSTDYLNSAELVNMRDWLESTVREKLGIPFNQASPGIRFEHSMGQSKIPANILRVSGGSF